MTTPDGRRGWPGRTSDTTGARVPRRVFDTTHAGYVWQWSNDPQYYVPLEDIDVPLIAEQHQQRLRFRVALKRGLRTVGQSGPAACASTGRTRFPGWRARLGSTGRRWTRGTRGTSRCSSTPRNPYVRGLTPSARIARFASSSTASCSPSPPARVGLRDRASEPLLHRPDRRPARAPATPPPRPHARARASHSTTRIRPGLVLSRASGGHQNRSRRSR